MKKILAVLLAMIMVLGSITVIYAADNEVFFGYCGYVSQDGDIIEGFNDETSVQGFVTIYNDNYVNTSLALTIALYDNSDRLVSIKTQTVNITEDIYKQKYYTPSLACTGGEGSYFRLYITKDLLSLRPLEMVYPLPWFDKPEDIRVSYKDIEEVVYSNGVIEFSYWKSETDRKPTTVTIFEEPEVYINEVLAGWEASFAVESLSDFYGYVTLSKKRPYTSEDYDYISIEDYETVVVETNATPIYKLLSKNYTSAISYDPYDEYISAKLYDEDGIEITWESLQTNDIVTIKRYTQYDETSVIGIKQTPNIVTGEISGIANEGTTDVQYTIGDNQYGIDLRSVGNTNLTLGFEATFYIDIMGNITYYEEPPVKYAYISNIGSNGNFNDERTALRVYTADGKLTTFTTAQSVKVDGIAGISSTALLDDVAVTKNYADSQYLIYNEGTDWYNVGSDGCITGIKAIEPGQVITYKTNSAGYVTVIDRPSAENPNNSFTQYYEDLQTLTYRASSDCFIPSNNNRVYLTEDTRIIVAPTMDGSGNIICSPDELTKDDFKLVNLLTLDDEQILENAMAYNVDADRNVALIVVNTLPSGVEYIVPEEEQPTPPDTEKTYYGYVSKIGDNGNTLNNKTAMVIYTTDGEYVELEVASMTKVDGVSSISGEDIADNMYRSMSTSEYESLVRKQGNSWFTYDDNNDELTIYPIEPGQVISYMVNSNGRIWFIDRPDTNASAASFKQYSIMTETIEYSADENALKLSNGNLYVTENTKIMIAPTLDKDGWFICLPNELAEEDFALFDISMLTDGQRFYNAITYLADAEGNAEFVLVNSEVEMAEPVANMALVKSVGATENENYYPVYSIKALREGEEQTLYTIDDSMFIQQYSTILPTFDMNGKVKSVDVLATVVNNSSVTFNNPDSFATEDTKYYYGQLTEMSKRTITVGGEEISIPASANVYVYNSGASSSNRVSIDTIDIIDYDGDTFWCGRYQCNVYTVVRECKGEVIDVVLYILENEY